MSKRKLLLADDSITIQKVVNLTFADEGIEVIAVGDGDAAMRKFEEFIPDLVMADVNMPGMNGYEICEIVKKNDITKHIPVILLVGSFEPFDEEAARAAGADDFLTKPFQSIRQLVNKVTDFLNRPAGAVAPVTEPEEAVSESVAATETESDLGLVENTPTDYGDAGMDDEMIETSPVRESSSGFDIVPPNDMTIDYAKTQPLSADDLARFRDASPMEETPEVESPAEPASDEESSENVEEHEVVGATEEFGPEDEEIAQMTENAETDDSVLDYYSPEAKADSEHTVFEESAPATDWSSPEFQPATSVPEPAADDSADILEHHPDDDQPAATETEDLVEAETEPSPVAVNDEMVRVNDETPEEFTPAETDQPESADESTSDEPEPVSEESVLEESVSDDAAETPVLESAGVDDGDLLELPPLIEETGIRPAAMSFVEPAAEPEPAAETSTTETSEADASAMIAAFPPELIDAIAKKVAEQISAKTMSDVLPQITELVLKKMAEEKKD